MASRRSSNWSRRERCGAESLASGVTRKTKIKVAMARARQARRMARSAPEGALTQITRVSLGANILFLGLLICLLPCARQELRRNFRVVRRGPDWATPVGDHHENDHQAEEERNTRDKPSHAIEALRWRLGQGLLAVLLDEGLEREIVRFVARHDAVQLLQHGR